MIVSDLLLTSTMFIDQIHTWRTCGIKYITVLFLPREFVDMLYARKYNLRKCTKWIVPDGFYAILHFMFSYKVAKFG